MTKKPVAYDSYEKFAELYAKVIKANPPEAHMTRPAIRALAPQMRGWRVLDAGCGTGINLNWLIEQGASEVVGTDVSPKMLAIAREEVTAEGVSLHLADLSQPLDFLVDASFDLVFSAMVIHYVEDLNALYAEFARLLKSGGYLIFSTHHPYKDYQRHGGSYFESRLVTQTWNVKDEAYTISYYYRPMSAITEALAQSGFMIERVIETLPTEDYRHADPEGYVKRMENPSFLCIRARKG